LEKEKKVQAIHNATMNVMENVGLIVHNPEIIELFKKNGIKTQGKRVFLKEKQIMEWLKKAPTEFKIHARNNKYDMLVGGDNIEFGPGNSGTTIMTDYDGTERDPNYDDFTKFLKLTHVSEHFNINSGNVTPYEIKSEVPFPHMLYSMIDHSDKCIFGGNGGKVESQRIVDMLKIVFGEKEVKEKAYSLSIVSSASPLQYDKNMTDTLIECSKNNQAVVISPAVMAGSTGPVTVAGSIVVSNAESILGAVMTQMVKPGSPVIYGSATSSSDMRNGSFSIGSPESALCVDYAAELAKMYGLPSRGGGTLVDARNLSIQSAYEAMMILFSTVNSGINYVLHTAGFLGAYNSMSLEKFVVDMELLDMVKKYKEGLDVSENDLAVDVIKEIGPGGEFITSMHTYGNFKKSAYFPDLSIRGPVIGKDQEKVYHENIKKKMDKMLNSYEKPYFPKDTKSQLVKYLEEKGYQL